MRATRLRSLSGGGEYTVRALRQSPKHKAGGSQTHRFMSKRWKEICQGNPSIRTTVWPLWKGVPSEDLVGFLRISPSHLLDHDVSDSHEYCESAIDADSLQAGRLPNKFRDPNDPQIPSTLPSSNLATINSESIQPSSSSLTKPADQPIHPDTDGVYPNGYKFPPKHNWKESTVIGLKGFWRFCLTPFGFLVVLYGLNVVAWGGMLFLLLIGGGSQYMCYPERLHGKKDCNDLYSPRRIWIEIDSQILNALFCVTGLGLIPWRFRDLYYLIRYRILKQQDGLRRLAGIHRSWFRMEGTEHLPVPLEGHETPEIMPLTALPHTKNPSDPLTGVRAPPTKLWKLDFVIWAYVWNTFLQITLCVFMWALNRFDRPSWSTGTFVALACIVAGLGGLMAGVEGKRVKKVEGVPVEGPAQPGDVERGVEEKQEERIMEKKDTKTTENKAGP